jgi:hypothetical protein
MMGMLSRIAYPLLAALALAFLAHEAIVYVWQPLVDVHAFRQTQTALTAYWMQKEGFTLPYQTPVVGFPWAIPFEFPIYQAIVVLLSSSIGLDLSATGRLVSFFFLVACALPIFGISRRLDWPNLVPWVILCLLWTSPFHVYWGRTFMIETTALFFALVSLMYAIDVFRWQGGWYASGLFVLFASAAVLQKSTTEGPVLLFLILAMFPFYLKKGRSGLQNKVAWAEVLRTGACIALPLCIGLVWAHYTDVVKSGNAVGAQLVSGALTRWNFGSLAQKLDPKTWMLLWERCFGQNASGFFGASILLLPWFYWRGDRRLARYSLAALALFVLPLAIFTNLHFVHEYYQVACLVFLLAAIALAIASVTGTNNVGRAISLILTVVLMVCNVITYNGALGTILARPFRQLDIRSLNAYDVGRFLRDNTAQGSGIVVFGQGYSSEVAFHSERKAMTTPEFLLSRQREVWEHPERYLGSLPLSAIVVCPTSSAFPDEKDVQEKMVREPDWRLTEMGGCIVMLRVDHGANTVPVLKAR